MLSLAGFERGRLGPSRTLAVLSLCAGLFLATSLSAQTDRDGTWEGVGGFFGGTVSGALFAGGVAISRTLFFDEAYYGFDALQWLTAFGAAGAAAGAAYGATHPDDLGEVLLSGYGGWAAGAVVGFGLGWVADPERKLGWAVLGGAIGLLSATILTVAGDDDDDPAASALRAPVTLLRLKLP